MVKPGNSGVSWKLKKGSDRRVKSGHPWVYSNELSLSPKGIESGQAISLFDAGGGFVARGYGNPHSLIAFRVVTRDSEESAPMGEAHCVRKLVSAWKFRKSLGREDFSFRLCYGEADFLPGLVIDRYRVGTSQVLSVQAHTAGAQVWAEKILEILPEFISESECEISWDKTAVVLRNDLSIRKLEGLEPEAAAILKSVSRLDLSDCEIWVKPLGENSPNATLMKTDLVGGQKTGFFLDQSGNVELAYNLLKPWAKSTQNLKILDLCTYVGQWSAQLGGAFARAGKSVEVTAVDSSAKALQFAKRNIQAQSKNISCQVVKGDVLKDLEPLPAGHFDLVISDPPALIQSRKDLPAGAHAYLQLNTQAMRVLRPGGALIACSCSALWDESQFLETLAKASRRNQASLRWIGRGAQAADHPMLAEFPEGRYLKTWIGLKGEK